MAQKDRNIVGASKSLNKTITDIMEHMGDDGERPAKGLRNYLYEKIADLTEDWYKKGFNRGHRESHRHFADTGEVPLKLTLNPTRKLAPKQKRTINLKSKIKKPKLP